MNGVGGYFEVMMNCWEIVDIGVREGGGEMWGFVDFLGWGKGVFKKFVRG